MTPAIRIGATGGRTLTNLRRQGDRARLWKARARIAKMEARDGNAL